MAASGYDIVTIGGGLSGSCLARTMADKGARVLILERETAFKDRVRGEALLPWGVGEARRLGIYDVLVNSCGHEPKWFDVFMGPNQLMHRDLSASTPDGAHLCNFYHPKMQETLINAAEKAGAEVVRGAIVTGTRTGSRPTVTYHRDGATHEVQTRLIVAADGRGSSVRKWAGFSVKQDPPSLFLAGVLFDNTPIPEDASYLLVNPMSYTGAYLFPQGNGRARAYFAYPVTEHRLQGDADIPRFIEGTIKAGAPAEYYRGVKAAGPLASFETADTWAPHPYKAGVALLGDAAGSSDPCWGTGLSLGMRGARVLRDRLLANENWDQAGHEYAEETDRAFGVIHDVTSWSREIFMDNSPQAHARREKAMPLIAADPTRVPDHGVSGPDIPFDKAATRARFYGEA